MKNLISTFHTEIDTLRRTGHKEFALGIVTKVVSSTQFKAVNVRENESALIAENSEAFQSQVYGKTYTEIHRIFVDYTVDLLDEILSKRQILKNMRIYLIREFVIRLTKMLALVYCLAKILVV
jgi:hypothetical protein